MSLPRLVITGSAGRMGQALHTAAAALSLEVVASLDQGDDLSAGISQGDVVIDFSSHTVTAEVIRLIVQHGKALVVGTTGHTSEEKAALVASAGAIPTVWAGNYSVGVNLLYALTRRAAAVLGSDYDAEVIEMHHRYKKDAPSGTAARMLEIILEERKLTENALRHGRQGITGARTDSEVGIHSLRGGDVVGEHTAIFAALGERLELTHRATDRGIYAQGALRAAQWVISQPAGVYDMQHVLGLD
ncbi:MAG: 4-hydroxy-tetrahydrodipicolinate reductase [Candidatus Synoicihabitans palmerolidicus]|nr:4-hydroxy-tetrahydrodipicolinate reductase [Candidatus Synoicihabitans palmerolidicus]